LIDTGLDGPRHCKIHHSSLRGQDKGNKLLMKRNWSSREKI